MSNNKPQTAIEPEAKEPDAKSPDASEDVMRDLGFLLNVPLQISVEIGRTRIPVKDLLQMQEGSIIELDKLAGEPLELYVNSQLIARGEVVLVKDKYGLRLTDVVSPTERIENLA